MKLEKKHYAMIIAGIVVLFLVYWLFFRKKKTESSYAIASPSTPIVGVSRGGVSPIVSSVGGVSAVNTGAIGRPGGIGTTSGSSRIKPWGGKMENGQKMCFDDGAGKYVVCSSASSKA